jgi:hypothetical protein
MVNPLETVVMSFKVIFFFLVLCFFIPSRVIKYEKDDKILDKFFISLFHSSTVIIVLVYLLSLIKLYDSFSMYLSLIIIYLILLRFKTKKSSIYNFGMRSIVSILDLSEGRYGLFGGIKRKFFRFIINLINQIKIGFKEFVKNPFSGILLFIVLLYGAYLRFLPSFSKLNFLAPDTYVHQVWIKFLSMNELFAEAIYPRGYHAIISVMSKLFFIDTYFILRFIGPLAGVLIIVSIIYAAKRLFVKNQFICFIAVFIYVFIADIPINEWRQIVALPQEYALFFLLPGVVFYIKYLNTRSIKYLILASEAIFITLLIHPYVTVPLGITFIIVALFNIKTFIRWQVFKNNILMFFGAISLGVLPQIIGLRNASKNQQGAFNFITESIRFSEKDPVSITGSPFTILYEPADYLRYFIILIFAYLIINFLVRLFLLKKDNVLEKQQLNTANIMIVSSLILYYLYRAPYYGFPIIMELPRIGTFFSILAVISFSIILLYINMIFKKKLFVMVISIVLCISFIYIANNDDKIKHGKLSGINMEYNDSVEAYLKIKNEFKPFMWNIVSPVQQYPLTMGHGWHFELWELAQALDEKNKEKLTIEIPDLFIFVEKKVYPHETPVSEELAKQSFIGGYDLLSDYYRGQTRLIIQSKVYYWAEDFLQANDEMTVYYESDVLKVYHLHNEDYKKPLPLID